jgi:organic hydroperoxide reductase OsmC/OhrA
MEGRPHASRLHTYRLKVDWTGNLGRGTESYGAYARDFLITAPAKAPIHGSSDLAFRGNPQRWNPEELLLAAVAACHKLWYLHLCAVNGISVLSYRDEPEATMQEEPDGAGRFVAAVLRPRIVVRHGDDRARARSLHDDAHSFCFIANSVSFPITCEPTFSADP